MIFKSIHLKEGLYEKKIDFKNGVNLIYSKKIVGVKLHFFDLCYMN